MYARDKRWKPKYGGIETIQPIEPAEPEEPINDERQAIIVEPGQEGIKSRSPNKNSIERKYTAQAGWREPQPIEEVFPQRGEENEREKEEKEGQKEKEEVKTGEQETITQQLNIPSTSIINATITFTDKGYTVSGIDVNKLKQTVEELQQQGATNIQVKKEGDQLKIYYDMPEKQEETRQEQEQEYVTQVGNEKYVHGAPDYAINWEENKPRPPETGKEAEAGAEEEQITMVGNTRFVHRAPDYALDWSRMPYIRMEYSESQRELLERAKQDLVKKMEEKITSYLNELEARAERGEIGWDTYNAIGEYYNRLLEELRENPDNYIKQEGNTLFLDFKSLMDKIPPPELEGSKTGFSPGIKGSLEQASEFWASRYYEERGEPIKAFLMGLSEGAINLVNPEYYKKVLEAVKEKAEQDAEYRERLARETLEKLDEWYNSLPPEEKAVLSGWYNQIRTSLESNPNYLKSFLETMIKGTIEGLENYPAGTIGALLSSLILTKVVGDVAGSVLSKAKGKTSPEVVEETYVVRPETIEWLEGGVKTTLRGEKIGETIAGEGTVLGMESETPLVNLKYITGEKGETLFSSFIDPAKKELVILMKNIKVKDPGLWDKIKAIVKGEEATPEIVVEEIFKKIPLEKLKELYNLSKGDMEVFLSKILDEAGMPSNFLRQQLRTLIEKYRLKEEEGGVLKTEKIEELTGQEAKNITGEATKTIVGEAVEMNPIKKYIVTGLQDVFERLNEKVDPFLLDKIKEMVNDVLSGKTSLGEMAELDELLKRLPASDRNEIIGYLKLKKVMDQIENMSAPLKERLKILEEEIKKLEETNYESKLGREGETYYEAEISVENPKITRGGETGLEETIGEKETRPGTGKEAGTEETQVPKTKTGETETGLGETGEEVVTGGEKATIVQSALEEINKIRERAQEKVIRTRKTESKTGQLPESLAGAITGSMEMAGITNTVETIGQTPQLNLATPTAEITGTRLIEQQEEKPRITMPEKLGYETLTRQQQELVQQLESILADIVRNSSEWQETIPEPVVEKLENIISNIEFLDDDEKNLLINKIENLTEERDLVGLQTTVQEIITRIEQGQGEEETQKQTITTIPPLTGEAQKQTPEITGKQEEETTRTRPITKPKARKKEKEQGREEEEQPQVTKTRKEKLVL